MHLLLIYFSCVGFLNVALSQECVSPLPVENFNATQFAGQWFEIKRFQNDVIGGDCGEVTYTINGSDYDVKYLTRNDSKDIKLKKLVEGMYDIYLNDTKIDIPHIVVQTDYTSYGVVYGCYQQKRLLFIYSRVVTLNETHNNNITELLNKLKISDTNLEVVNQNETYCNRNNSGIRIFPGIGTVLLIYLFTNLM